MSVYDIGTDDEQPFLVMELVEGETLADLIRRGPLAPAQVASLGGQLADSLQAIHDAGVIHRDIKPANVLVCGSDDGAALRTKLTDFGIARLVDGTRLTSTGLLIGTVQYLSPEQTVGGTVSLPSDVYALGLVLLECLTGRAAFPGVGIETAVVRLSRQPEIPAELGPRWADVLGAMTVREPEQRPTAGEVASLLSALSAPGSGEQDAASVRPVAPAAAATPAAAAATPAAAAAAPAGHQPQGGPPTEVGLVPARAGASGRRRRRAWSVSVGAAAALATAVMVAATWSGTSATGEPATGATIPAPSPTASAAHAQTADPASAASPARGTTGTRASSRHGGTTSAPDPGPSSPTASPTGQQSSTTSAPTTSPASAPPTTAPESSDRATTPVTSASGTPGPDRTGNGTTPTGQATTPSPQATEPTPTTQPSPTSDQPGKGGKPQKGDKPKKHKPKGNDHPAPGQPTGGPTSPSGNLSGEGGVLPVIGQP